jgi:predicted transcriptional regulator
MKPIDYRNDNFVDVQATINGRREEVLTAWQEHGPCTTEELAERSGISVLTLRPRTTDLYQLGFVVLEGGNKRAGIYRAATSAEVLQHFRDRQAKAQQGVQTDLFSQGLQVPRHSSDRQRRIY